MSELNRSCVYSHLLDLTAVEVGHFERRGGELDLINWAAGSAGTVGGKGRTEQGKGQNTHLYSTMWCMLKNQSVITLPWAGDKILSAMKQSQIINSENHYVEDAVSFSDSKQNLKRFQCQRTRLVQCKHPSASLECNDQIIQERIWLSRVISQCFSLNQP